MSHRTQRRALFARTGLALASSLALSLAAAPAAPGAIGDIYVVDQTAMGGRGGVILVQPSTAYQRTRISANNAPAGAPRFNFPTGIALGPPVGEEDFSIYVADPNCCTGGQGGVIRVDPSTGVRTLVSDNANPAQASGPDFEDPTGVAVESDGDILVSDEDAYGGLGGVIRVNPTTGERSTVSENASPVDPDVDFGDPHAIAVKADGQIRVLDTQTGAPNGTLIGVDPSSGDRTLISDNANPVGVPDFARPLGLPAKPANPVYVTDADAFNAGRGGVISVDDTAGTRTRISESNNPAGAPSFLDPADVDVMPVSQGGHLVMTDANAPAITGSIIDVDPAAGTRTVLSENVSPPGAPLFDNPYGLVVKTLLVFIALRPGPIVLDRPPGWYFDLFADARSRVAFTLERRVAGRVVEGRCRPQTARNRGGRRCTAYRRVGGFSRRVRRGRTRVRPPRSLHRRLRPGTYRARVVGRTSRGDVSPPASVNFKAVRR
ncbi:MAG: hypothetical protein M3141_04395 [Actinomycetota bacterium]|nr:hypothetical protein [Actinomycetota bacterium]